MSDFDTTRTALDNARRESRASLDALDAAQRKTARAQARYDVALRNKTAEAARPLQDALKLAREEEARSRDAFKTASAAAQRKLGEFATLSDPRKAVGAWPDDTPALLLPVRLETRFMHIEADGVTREELWVRVYPDTCAVDTFEAVLSEGEAESGRRFWIESWAAGGIEAQRRAAWRNLVASHGIGRAAWIVREYVPVNPQAMLQKIDAQDIVLVIATDVLPSVRERQALSIYWKAIWLAPPSTSVATTALQALAAAPGVSDAAQLVENFVPANIAATPSPPKLRSDVVVDVAWLQLPAPTDVKLRSWNAPARVHVLPDRFVVIGYQDGKPVFEELGAAIPSPLTAGPDPSAPANEQLKHDANGALLVPAEMKWMVDFESAVVVGMGIRIVLDTASVDLNRPIERVVALGVRLADDAGRGRLRLEELLLHHRYGNTGLAIVPQGTPTNNTDTEGAGYSSAENADAAFDSLFTAAGAVTPSDDWWQRQDGQALSDALGIDPAIVDRIPHASGTDVREARAMNRVLWPATFGYALETMLHPVFNAAQVDTTRWFQTHFVSGRGPVPAVRIGQQPYGILVTSALSAAQWLEGDRIAGVGGLTLPPGFIGFRKGLADLLAVMRTHWRELAAATSFVGNAGDPHQILLDVLGLHPASVEFHQRNAESLEHIFNRAKFEGIAGQILLSIQQAKLQEPARALLRQLGYHGEVDPDALSRFFFSHSNRLNGPLVDDRPLSEATPVRAYTDDRRNYLHWLGDAARSSFEDLRLERGFTADRAPDALLYVLLRHALLLGYWDSSLRLHVEADVLSAPQAALARRESAFVHVTAGDSPSESRFQTLYSADARVAQGASTVVERIRSIIGNAGGTQGLADQLAALDLLRDAPTARLERCLAEHIDLASFRLDAWLLGLSNYQLAAMRLRPSPRGEGVETRRGIHLGAYGWLEQLQRKPDTLSPVKLAGELADLFAGPADSAPLMRDPANGGYILAPSLNQATSAAILRAGYLANASPQAAGALAVNLSSARVRSALGLIEGIRNGQPLGALLGYRLQRGLHEGHAPLELDRFIYPLRKRFPLVADQLESTRTEEGVSIEAIEANNVIDGLKLLEHIRKIGGRNYPFGLDLPSANASERAAIDGEVGSLIDAHDALADLALAEGVHQAVLGNYDRVGATMDGYAKGTFPPEPEIVRTPRSGLTLTHRVGLHFKAGVDPEVSPIAGVDVSPRSRAQAMVNAWLLDVLPDAAEVGCSVEWFDPVANAPQQDTVTQLKLKLQPIDLLYLVALDGDASMSELDDRIARYILDTHSPRPDSPIAIRHTARLAAPLKSFFELAPLIRNLRSLLLRSRPLVPTDFALSGEAAREQDVAVSIMAPRVTKVRTALNDLGNAIDTVPAVATVDELIEKTVGLFERAAKFGIQQVGWGFIYEWRRRAFGDALDRVRSIVARWDDQLDAFDVALIDYDALPPVTPDDERYSALGRIDLLVAAAAITPRPATPAAYRAALPARRGAMDAKNQRLQTLLSTAETRVSALLPMVSAELPLTAFDLTPISFDDLVTDVTKFVEEIRGRLKKLRTEVSRRLSLCDAQVLAAGATSDPAAIVAALLLAGSALLGEDLKLIPEFKVNGTAGAELVNAYGTSVDGSLTDYLVQEIECEFPADDWLHGIARVREKMHAWEQVAALAPTLGGSEPALTPIQLPHVPGEGWLAMQFDATKPPLGERLLYTANYPSGFVTGYDPAAATCGLLLDEWTEVVPSRDETAGLSFHYDRPGSEPPQSWLLVTPAQMRGKWEWSDLLGALHETLDLARLRAVEPAHVDTRAYARFLPATTSAVTLYGVSITANYARVNNVAAQFQVMRDG
jgi:hypothetical protein